MLPAEPQGGRQQALVPVAGQGVCPTHAGLTPAASAGLLVSPLHPRTVRLALPSSLPTSSAVQGQTLSICKPVPRRICWLVTLGWRRPMARHVGDGAAPHRDWDGVWRMADPPCGTAKGCCCGRSPGNSWCSNRSKHAQWHLGQYPGQMLAPVRLG